MVKMQALGGKLEKACEVTCKLLGYIGWVFFVHEGNATKRPSAEGDVKNIVESPCHGEDHEDALERFLQETKVWLLASIEPFYHFGFVK